MELNRDELRRQVRDLDRAHREAESDERLLTNLIVDGAAANQPRLMLGSIDRRNFLRIGGIAIAGTTLLAACREAKPKAQVPLSGENPGYSDLPNRPIDDIVLLRTATSLEFTVIDAYQRIINNKFELDPAVADMLKVFSEHHAAHAAATAEATTQLGGVACTGLNTKMTSYMVEPLIARIAESGANQGEDVKALAFALESLAASTYQVVLPSLTSPALRRAAMSVGGVEARHAALLGAIINPAALAAGDAAEAAAAGAGTDSATTDTAAATTVQLAYEANSIHAVPSTFGLLSPYVLTVGPANENGVRQSSNIDTPSLNSFMYADEAC
jgi:hypothetical protein